MKTCLRVTTFSLMFCLFATTAFAENAADALLKEVTAKNQAELPLIAFYQITLRHQDKVRTMQARLKKNRINISFFSRPIPGENNLPYQLWSLFPVAELMPLPTEFPFYTPLPPREKEGVPEEPDAPIATRLLAPEIVDGKSCEVVEVANPLALFNSGAPRFSNEIGMSLQKCTARYYIGEDKRIRRITADFILRAKPDNSLRLPETSAITVEIVVTKIEKGQIPVERPKTPPPIRKLNLPEDTPRMVTLLSPNGSVVIAGLRDGGVVLYDAVTGKESRTLEGHLSAVVRLSTSANGAFLASQSEDGVVALWDITLTKLLRTYRYDPASTALSLSPDGSWLAVNVPGKGVTVSRVRTGETAATLPELLVARLVFSSDSKTLTTLTMDGVVKLWDTGTWKAMREFQALREPEQQIGAALFSPDSKLLVVGGVKGGLEVWETGTGKQLQRLSGTPSEVVGLAFSPEGKWLAVADADRITDFPGSMEMLSTAVTLWDTQTWKPTQTLAAEQGGDCKGVLFLEGGKSLAKFGAAYRPLTFWEVNVGR